jgi:hypothetical protein
LLLQLALGGLTEDPAAALRELLDARLPAASEGSPFLPAAAAEAHGHEVWTRCEALSAGELAHKSCLRTTAGFSWLKGGCS